MNNMVWDAVLWLKKKMNRDKEDIIQAVNNIQNLFEASADATASPSDILEGQTAYNGTALITGTMRDRKGTTVTADEVTQDENYTYFGIPEAGYYDTNSKLRSANSNIYGNLRMDSGKISASTSLSTGYQTKETSFTIPADCMLVQISSAVTGRYYWGYKIFVNDVLQGENNDEISLTNVQNGTVIKLWARSGNNADRSVECSVSANTIITYLHKS